MAQPPRPSALLSKEPTSNRSSWRFPPLVCRNLLGRTVRVPQDLQGQLSVLVVGFKAAHYDDMNSWMPFATKLGREIMEKHKLDVPLVQSYRLVVRHRAGVLLRWWTDERLRFAIGTEYSEPSMPRAEKVIEKAGETGLGPAGETLDAREVLDPAVEPPACIKVESADSSSGGQTPEEIRLATLYAARSRTLVCFTDKSAFVDALQLADAQRVYVFLLDKTGDIAWSVLPSADGTAESKQD
ncbi:hypothetical protein, conserved [Eimeria acervulina]|uniref:Uncharacterized protein n=1 Tax=Eimeria acervulina TaxID=5801 RepID=U6GYQ3_EIMAC|nr:hypothetical protein, conserved [Eimeria acervulina]CDI83639.1 hypothetical protein, conserved [Eimeria acervulina]